MNFFLQIKEETRQLFRTRFILIITIITLLLSLLSPILTKIEMIASEDAEYGYGITETIVYETGYSTEDAPLTINGITINPENPLYWDINFYYNEAPRNISGTEKNFDIQIFDALRFETLDYYLMWANSFNDSSKSYYQSDLLYKMQEQITEKFILESTITNPTVFIDTVQLLTSVNDFEELIAMSLEEKNERLQYISNLLELTNQAITNNDIVAYSEVLLIEKNHEIDELRSEIKLQEQAIIDNPELEESGSIAIENLNQSIKMILDVDIPVLELRKSLKIEPYSEKWESNALRSFESSSYSILHYSKILTEEEYREDNHLNSQYSSYNEYYKSMQLRLNQEQFDLLVAEQSLNSGEPDMKFVHNGARHLVNSSLSYSITIACLSILIGGYVIANEFQSGTIRLLMIRPSTRFKIYTSKFIAGLIVCLAVYLIGMVLNIIGFGIVSGFADYGYPNYTASGQVNFWPLIIGRILACTTTIILAYSLSFLISTLTKNTALSTALPAAAVFGSTIAASILAWSDYARALVYTPIPYVSIYRFFSQYGIQKQLSEQGINISLGVGIIYLLIVSCICYILGLYVFKKKDITN